jgi:hypothetical protein
VPPEAWDDPAVQEKLQQWIEGMGAPPGLLTKILKPGLWRQLMTTPSINRAGQKVPRGTTSAWSEMRHTGTDYDVGAKLPIGRAMYRNQAGFNTGTEVALDLAKQAIGFRKPQYAQAIVDWLRMKAGEHGYQVGGTSWDEILKLLGPTK